MNDIDSDHDSLMRIVTKKPDDIQSQKLTGSEDQYPNFEESFEDFLQLEQIEKL